MNADKNGHYPMLAYIQDGRLYLLEACTPCSASVNWLPDGCIKPESGFEGIGDVYRPASMDHDPVAFRALAAAVTDALIRGKVLRPGRYKLTYIKVKKQDVRDAKLLEDN